MKYKRINIVETVLIEFNVDIVTSLKEKGTKSISIHTKKNNIIKIIPEAEELGFVGATALIALYSCFIWLIFSIAKKSLERGDFFGGYSCFFAGFLFAFQFSINIGVNSGLLPTKGLTLPLISYGGSSLIVSLMILGFLLRVSQAKDNVIG